MQHLECLPNIIATASLVDILGEVRGRTRVEGSSVAELEGGPAVLLVVWYEVLLEWKLAGGAIGSSPSPWTGSRAASH